MGFGCAVLNFGLWGVTNAAGVTIFAILYGFFSGGCEQAVYLRSLFVERD